MPITLPPDLDHRIQQKIAETGGSPDEVIRKALDALDAEEQSKTQGTASKKKKPSGLPVWQRFANAARTLPENERASLPRDGATEHDHYLYGLPKRSA